MKIKQTQIRVAPLIATGQLLIVGLAAHAQNSELALEEIIVTAQKREQSIQDVPISINAVTAETFTDYNIDSFNEFEFPGMITTEGGRTNMVAMRGIRSGENSGFEQSVPFFIDGMYLGRARATRIGFLDLERLELLKGPQPTYLGKNAIGGAISLVTRRPTDEFESGIDTAYEFAGEEANINGYISGPLSDTVNARLAIKFRDMGGWMQNTALDEDWPQEENTAARVSLTWNPSDRFEAYAKLETYRHNNVGQARELFACTPGVEPTIGPDEDCELNGTTQKYFNPALNAPDSNLFEATRPEQAHVDNVTYTSALLDMTWDMGDYTLTSVTSYYDLESILETEVGDSIVPTAFVDLDETAEQFSQEIRLRSAGGGRVEWLIGAYLDQEKVSTANMATIPILNVAFNQHMREQKSDSWAVFGEVAVNLSETVTATLGARQVEVQKDADYERFAWAMPRGSTALGPVIGPASFTMLETRTDDDFTPSVVLEWRPLDDTMLYASWKDGFKAGGYDHSHRVVADPTQFQYEPESVTAVELGAKLSRLGGAISANFALFRSVYEGLQVTQRNVGPGFRTTNAAESTSQGLEIDTALRVNEYVTLGAVLNWLDANYEDFNGAQCRSNPPQTMAEGCINGGQDLAGETLPYAPDFTAQLRMDMQYPLQGQMFGDDIALVSGVNLFSTSAFHTQTSPDPDQTQESFNKVDARLGVAAADGRWALELFGRNLTDQYTFTLASTTPVRPNSNIGVLARTRQLGLRFNYQF